MNDLFPPSTTSLSLTDFLSHSPIPMISIDQSGNVLRTNFACDTLTKQSIHAKKTQLRDFLSDEDKGMLFNSIKLLREQSSESHQTSAPPITLTLTLPSETAENEVLTLLTHITARNRITPQEEEEYFIHFIDQSEQKNLELRFAHSQKMQAVGQLAGGVAHDFNNLLTAMIGFCDLLLMRHPAGDPSFADIMQVKQNANRAANLVRQLLAFSRKQTLQPKIIDLTDVLAELSNLLRRLIGENIELRMQHGRNIGKLKADQGQLEQVIINLAVNARDAMKEGGLLSIVTSQVDITNHQSFTQGWHFPAEDEIISSGRYIQIDIEDTGHGIPQEILDKVFEPFFSTKEVGSGTGLGLATVLGIVKQTEGYLLVKSNPDNGTSFRILFAAQEEVEKPQRIAEEPEQKNSDLTGQEVILLVEDEAPVRTFASRALANKGYKVIEAESGEHALEVLAEYEGKLDVMVSDVIMPGINGPTMLETIEKQFPALIKDTKIIFISGYTEDAFAESFTKNHEFSFLPKPFTLKQLAGKVKDVLAS